MKINKLLFFLLAVISLNSCAEYVDYGVVPEGSIPMDFKANVKPTAAKYVGDTFEFEAKLNNTPVTPSTTFKVNGNEISGYTYVPLTDAEYTVVATFEIPGSAAKVATFKFKAEKKPTTEPGTGNRIEYNGNNPLNTTYFILDGVETQQGVNLPPITMPDGVTPASSWIMVNFSGNDPNTAANMFLLEVLVPLSGNNILFPFESQQVVIMGANVEVNNTEIFTVNTISLAFGASGNTPPSQQGNGNANYTSMVNGSGSGQTAELFWNGEYLFGIENLSAQSKGVAKKIKMNPALQSNPKNLKVVKK